MPRSEEQLPCGHLTQRRNNCHASPHTTKNNCHAVTVASCLAAAALRLAAFLQDTGQALHEWEAAERAQLALHRSEVAAESGNVLADRLRAHAHLAWAA